MPNFRRRLTIAQQRVYDRSNAISSLPLRSSHRLFQAVQALPQALQVPNRSRVERVSQAIADEITGTLHVPRVRIVVEGQRPSNARGELHGLYIPAPGGSGTIRVWMVTAKRGQVVAFKTFLRTLLHEICHHLDYAFLNLTHSFHTDGFYKRESSLFYQIGGPAAADRAVSSGPAAERGARPPGAAG